MNLLSDRLAKRLPFFYGYLMLLLALLMQLGTSPGQTYAVSAFTPSLLSDLHLTESRLGLAYMLGTLLAAVPLTLVGPAADRHGLKNLVEELLGESISKAQQSSDWGAPKINDAQRDYAASDVRYLHRLHDVLVERPA